MEERGGGGGGERRLPSASVGGKGGTEDSGLRRRETAQHASSPIWCSDIGCVKPPRSAAAQAILFSDAQCRWITRSLHRHPPTDSEGRASLTLGPSGGGTVMGGEGMWRVREPHGGPKLAKVRLLWLLALVTIEGKGRRKGIGSEE